MTQDEIISMAKESGFLVAYVEQGSYYIVQPHGKSCAVELRNFSKLVAAKEREACAVIVENADTPDGWSNDHISEAIRARGEA